MGSLLHVQCLCMVVDAACKKKCDSFQHLLDNLMVMLHQHVSESAWSLGVKLSFAGVSSCGAKQSCDD